MKKILRKICIALLSVIGILFLFSLLFLLTLQTKWGQEKAKSALIQIAGKNNIALKIKEIEGALPFTLVIRSIEIEYDQKEIKIEKLTTDFSIIALLRKEISFPNLKAHNIFINVKEKKPDATTLSHPKPSTLNSSFPINLSFKSFSLKNVHINDLNFSAKGTLQLQKKLKNLHFNVSFTKKGFKNSYLKLIGQKENNDISITLKADIRSLKFFEGVSKLPSNLLNNNFDSLVFSINSKTTWNNLLDFIYSEKISSIKGESLGYFLPSWAKNHFEPFQFIFDFDLFSNWSMKIPRLFFKNDVLKVEGSSIFDPNFSLQNCFFTFKSDLSNIKNLKYPIKGAIDGKLLYIEKEATLTYGGNLEIQKHPINNLEGNIITKFENQNFQGKFTSQLDLYNERFTLSSDFSLNSDLKLSNFLISSPSLNGNADLKISKNFMIDGIFKTHFNNLSLFANFLPQSKINGLLDSEVNFSSDASIQNANLNTSISNFHYNDFFGDSLQLKMNIKDVFQKPSLDFNLSMNNARIHKIKIDSLSFSSSNEERHPYDLSLSGNWRTPLEVKSTGFWSLDESFLLNIQTLNGTLLQSSFSLVNPVDLHYGKEFSLKDFEIKMPDGYLKANLFLAKNRKEIEIDSKHFPIDFLSFNPLEVNITGFGSIKASFLQKDNKLQSSLSFLVDEMNLNSLSEEYILKTHGSMEAQINNENLTAKINFFKEDEKLLNLTSSLPLKIEYAPLKLDIDPDAPLKTDLALQIKIEDILDFFDLGNHHLEGDLNCNFSFTDTFANPHIDGSCTLQKGSYENYYSGTSLNNISFELLGNNNTLILKKFEADDEKKGKIGASGSFDLNSSNNYFFTLDILLSQMQLISTDLVTASFDGNIKVEGNKNQALAKGDVLVSNADFIIPDKLPRTMPELNVKFINKTIAPEAVKSYSYPLNLDITVSAPKHIFVKGKGVDAELKGSILLKGSYYDLIPEGKLELVKGTYLFSGRNFSLSEGTILFTGKEHVMPRLSIKADLPQEGYLISATLQGPINAPHLSFSSSPGLPLSSIISIILFGKDLSGISGLQALQLATTIAAISDTSSLLESTKRSLGIDRLTVVSKTGENSEDQVSVEVGKYVTRDILISIKQGLTEGTSNASVELNLGWGFILQLETLEEEEQSKGTLKWSRNF